MRYTLKSEHVCNIENMAMMINEVSNRKAQQEDFNKKRICETR